MTKEAARKIYNKFTKFTENGDKTLIEGLNINEIAMTLVHYSSDKDWPPYKAMELRLIELKEFNKEIRSKKEKWRDRIVGFILGILMSYIVQII